MKKIFFSILLITCYFLLVTDCHANGNIFGLHLTQTSDIHQARQVINSGGGDWGWATIVIRLDLLDHNMWQEFFDNCRRYHIIPIVRLGTIMENGYWKKPTTSDIDHLASFLNSLNWPSTPQYINLFNEVNHASEWGGEVNIKEYTDISIYTAQKLKSHNPDFFVMGAGMDLAAPDKENQYHSAPSVYKEIYEYNKNYFDLMDGLASHSYPNHGFIASPKATGQHSIKGYAWELEYLKKLGVNKEYPVFITETGWPHREGERKENKYYLAKTSASYLSQALSLWSADNRVKAITPFIFNYPYEPFDHFSWLKKDGSLYPEYQIIVDSPKKINSLFQSTRYELVNINLPLLILPNNEYKSSLIIKNTGQSIWGETKFCLEPNTSSNITTQAICVGDEKVEPGHTQKVNFTFHIQSQENENSQSFIGWNGLTSHAIEPLVLKGSLYRPKTGIKEALINIITTIFH